jgi:hypothetical protein
MQSERNRAEPQCYEGLDEPGNYVRLQKNPPITPFKKCLFLLTDSHSGVNHAENRALRKVLARSLRARATVCRKSE